MFVPMLFVVALGDAFAIDVCVDVVRCGIGRRIHHQYLYRCCSLSDWATHSPSMWIPSSFVFRCECVAPTGGRSMLLVTRSSSIILPQGAIESRSRFISILTLPARSPAATPLKDRDDWPIFADSQNLTIAPAP